MHTHPFLPSHSYFLSLSLSLSFLSPSLTPYGSLYISPSFLDLSINNRAWMAVQGLSMVPEA